MGMTLTEKLLANAAGRQSVKAGENVWVDVNVLMTHDVCGPGTIGIFKEKFGADALLPNIGERMRDFGDTAGILEQLDLVVSADTSVVHLAGAMDRPVWALIPFSPDWRWLYGRDDSPWYSSVRLFRQESPRDWPGVIARLRAELEAFAADFQADK